MRTLEEAQVSALIKLFEDWGVTVNEPNAQPKFLERMAREVLDVIYTVEIEAYERDHEASLETEEKVLND